MSHDDTMRREDSDVEHAVELAFCLPMMLVFSFSFAAYFWSLYSSGSRLRERRIQCLVFTSWLSFACLVGFAYCGPRALTALSDISENAILLTFVIQITVITRDAMNLCDLVSLKYFMRIAEAFIVVALVIAIFDVVTLVLLSSSTLYSTMRTLNEWLENVALVFIVSFRLYYILLSRGSFRAVVQNQPGGSMLYFMLVTHNYPFMIVRYATGLKLEFFEGFYMRALVLLCIWYTAREKQAAYGRRRIRATRMTTRNHALSNIAPGSPAAMTRHALSPMPEHATPSQHLRKLYRQQSAAVSPTQSATVLMSSIMAQHSRRSERRRSIDLH